MKNHGGKRQGAGRPKGTGAYGKATKVMRVPEDKAEDVKAFLTSGAQYSIPLYEGTVSAGTPFGVTDHVDRKLDLNEHLIKTPSATFFVRAAGKSMLNAGIDEGDLLVVDRSLDVKNGKIIIAVVNGDLTVKRYQRFGDKVTLIAENDDFEDIVLSDGEELDTWGVVTNIIKGV
ncbi:MAG: DNA polymerase V [Magnetococcales bacterium]|nr:DNA polymerase V [Magnetococcales bacterium]|tara:strand:+ start:10121 stop:10642 length:522 start_codon:yes stop_codon:yes gene_type:complete